MALISSRNIFNKWLITFSIRCKRYCEPSILYVFNARRQLSSYGLCDTTIFLQNGMDIQELPLIVKKISSSDTSHLLFNDDVNGSSLVDETPTKKDNVSGISRKEVDEIIDGFKRCNSIHEVIKLLEVVPSTYVEPTVAFHVVKKMIELDYIYSLVGEGNREDVSKNFTKTAVFNQLMGIVLSNNDCSVLVNCLKLMGQHWAFRKYLRPFEGKLYEQIMINATLNKFNVTEICEIIEEFHTRGNINNIDKLWIGITENLKNIDQHNIMNVFKVLPYFKVSRDVVAKTLLKKMTEIWYYVDSKSVVEILEITKTTRTYSHELLQILGRWLNTKIHSVSEKELQSILNGFKNLNFTNSQVISAIERYIKVRAELIENVFLFASIMEYFLHFKIRSPLILDKACDYFISKGNNLPPSVLRSFFVPYGYLHYSPTRSYEFWKKFEEILEDKFSFVAPEHITEIMLSCVFLEKYPINFTNYVFNPYFLNKLRSSNDWVKAKRNLRLYDHIMKSECPAYMGPLLSREDPPSKLFIDNRISALLYRYKIVFQQIASPDYGVFFSQFIDFCPVHISCLIDILFVPKTCNLSVVRKSKSYKEELHKFTFIALLVHLPEHYCHHGEENYLMGEQVVRKRHLNNFGLKVVSLNFVDMMMCGSSCGQLSNYVQSSIDQVFLQNSS